METHSTHAPSLDALLRFASHLLPEEARRMLPYQSAMLPYQSAYPSHSSSLPHSCAPLAAAESPWPASRSSAADYAMARGEHATWTRDFLILPLALATTLVRRSVLYFSCVIPLLRPQHAQQLIHLNALQWGCVDDSAAPPRVAKLLKLTLPPPPAGTLHPVALPAPPILSCRMISTPIPTPTRPPSRASLSAPHRSPRNRRSAILLSRRTFSRGGYGCGGEGWGGCAAISSLCVCIASVAICAWGGVHGPTGFLCVVGVRSSPRFLLRSNSPSQLHTPAECTPGLLPRPQLFRRSLADCNAL